MTLCARRRRCRSSTGRRGSRGHRENHDLLVFRASTETLICLYALGMFAAFALVHMPVMGRHWWKQRSPGWHVRLVINCCRGP